MDFVSHNNKDIKEMLSEIGVSDIEELISRALPEKARLKKELNLPPSVSEFEVLAEIEALSRQNAPEQGFISFLGAGVYHHFIPSVVDFITQRPEFFTAYTPYQAEVSQGTLASIFEFQTMISELTGLDVANASMYDGATALSEAVLMAHRLTGKKEATTVAVYEPFHPFYLKVLKTYLEPHNMEIVFLSNQRDLSNLDSKSVFAVVISQPDFYGQIIDYEGLIAEAKKIDALTIVVHDPHLLALLEPPGKLGADICVGEAQPLGNPVNFGGPLLGFMATKAEHLRQLPGRIVGETIDANGDRAFVMTLQTREQHIRRERATSNICTNEALCALAATVYLSWLGPEGFYEVSRQILLKTNYAAELFAASGKLYTNGPFFKDFVIRTKKPAFKVVKEALKEGILAGVPLNSFDKNYDEHLLLISVTEKNTREEIERLKKVIDEVDQ